MSIDIDICQNCDIILFRGQQISVDINCLKMTNKAEKGDKNSVKR